ncbi:MAG: ribosome recycling factor [Myxococcales bacterium]|nr:ribosome recycling factor [Myxococcales bacterium]
MIDEVLSELAVAINKAHEALKRDLAKLRTGRANSGMLDGIRVDYYGQSTPISQMASVGVPEPRMITVKPWEKNQVQAIERAIRESDLGFNPQTDGDLIRIPIPPLSEERRKDLAKLAKRNGEDCKVAIRKARHDAIDMLSDLKNEGEIGEDDQERAKKKVEEVVGGGVATVDQLVTAREKDIMEV